MEFFIKGLRLVKPSTGEFPLFTGPVGFLNRSGPVPALFATNANTFEKYLVNDEGRCKGSLFLMIEQFQCL